MLFFLLLIPAIKKVPIFAESCLAVDLEQSSNVSDQKIKFSCIVCDINVILIYQLTDFQNENVKILLSDKPKQR